MSPSIRSIIACVGVSCVVAAFAACEKKTSTPAPQVAVQANSNPTGSTSVKPKDEHKHDSAHAHSHESGDHDHGPTTHLAEQTVDGITVKASYDGELKAGSDVPIDVLITNTPTSITAVRFWVGNADGKGAMKAKAELEKANWHTHVELPNPLTNQSKLWVEIELQGGKRTTVGFALVP